MTKPVDVEKRQAQVFELVQAHKKISIPVQKESMLEDAVKEFSKGLPKGWKISKNSETLVVEDAVTLDTKTKIVHTIVIERPDAA